MTTARAPQGRRTPSRTGRLGVLGAASLASAVLTWLLQAVAGRVLGPTDYAAFMVLWGLSFLMIGCLLGLQQEVTRAVASPRPDPGDAVATGTSPLLLAAVVGSGGAAVLLVTSWWWGPRLFDAAPVAASLSFVAGFLAFAVLNAVSGVMAGSHRWTDVAGSVALEATLRLVAVVTVLALGAGVAGQAWALDVAALAWLALLLRPGVRRALRVRVGDGLARLVDGSLHAMLAAACSALVIAGFPVLLRLTSDGPLGAEAGVVLAAVVATRAPLLLPLNAFAALLLTRLVGEPDRAPALLLRLTAAVAAAGALGAALAFAVGPALLALLFGPAFAISRGAIAMLVVAAAVTAVLTLTGSGLLAAGRHRSYAVGQVLATLVVVGVLSLDLEVVERCVLALTAGPLAGLAWYVWRLRADRTPSPSA